MVENMINIQSVTVPHVKVIGNIYRCRLGRFRKPENKVRCLAPSNIFLKKRWGALIWGLCINRRNMVIHTLYIALLYLTCFISLSQLTIAVGDVKIQKPKFDYYNYQPKDPDTDWDAYGHVIEIYEFSSELITRDLLTIFKDFM